MRPIEPARVSNVIDHVTSFRSRRILLAVGALLLCSAETLFAQIDPAQLIDRNSSRVPTVSRNQLLAPVKAVRVIQRARKDIVDGHLESAQKEIARALDLAPHFAVAKVLQGAIDTETEHYEAARIMFQEAIDDDPALGCAYVGMAVVLIHERQFQAALPVLDRAEELLPTAWFVHFAKAWAQLELGNTEAAHRQAEFADRLAASDAQKRSGVSYLRAMVSVHLNDIATARKQLAEAIARDRGGQYAALANSAMEKLQPLLAAGR